MVFLGSNEPVIVLVGICEKSDGADGACNPDPPPGPAPKTADVPATRKQQAKVAKKRFMHRCKRFEVKDTSPERTGQRSFRSEYSVPRE